MWIVTHLRTLIYVLIPSSSGRGSHAEGQGEVSFDSES